MTRITSTFGDFPTQGQLQHNYLLASIRDNPEQVLLLLSQCNLLNQLSSQSGYINTSKGDTAMALQPRNNQVHERSRNNRLDPHFHHDESEEHDSGFSSGGFSLEIDQQLGFDRLQTNQFELLTSGFYYPSMDQQSAMKLLKRASVGSFVVRDSSHPKYLFSISIKSKQGATSVRVSYKDGLFCFDGDEDKPTTKPHFSSVVALTNFYCHVRTNNQNKNMTMRGKSDRKPVAIGFTKPLKTKASSLAHLCRVKINETLQQGDQQYDLSLQCLSLNSSCKQYLRDYPYSL